MMGKPTQMEDPGAAFERYLDERFPDQASRAEFEARVMAVNIAADFVEALDEIRQRREMTRAALAEGMGKDPAVISRLLNNRSANPTIATILELLEALDVYLSVDVKPQPTESQQRHAAIEISRPGLDLQPAACT
jgi:ribosome-binding protein aMBF1 (putative translation factor)